MGKKLDLSARSPPRRHIVVTTYDLAQKLRGYERHFRLVIADESHSLKNPATKRAQFFQRLLAPGGNVRCALFLTGTPAMSRPIELWTQASAFLLPCFVLPCCPSQHQAGRLWLRSADAMVLCGWKRHQGWQRSW